MGTARNPNELYAIEAYALSRCINGVDVDAALPIRPKVRETVNFLLEIEPKWREFQLKGLISPEAVSQVLAIDFMASPPKGRGKIPPGTMLNEAPAPETEAGAGQTVKPTDDELGEALIARWENRRAYIYGQWHAYEHGVWTPAARNSLEFWEILKENKSRGIKPNSGKASSVEAYCQLRLMVEDKHVDNVKHYINLQNGLFNLETGRMEPHRPDLYLTSQLDFPFDSAARCPHWLKFLDEVLVTPAGQPDRELITLMQEAFGYSLTAQTHLRASFWCIGPSGTGKSTLLKVLINLSGSGHLAIDLDAMKDNQYQLAEVAGKRLITFTEPDARSPLADGQYKRLVSSDTISARQIHGRPFNFIPQCKLWGAMNDTPRVMDRSDAVYGRIIIFPMLHIFDKAQWDLNIDEKLRLELPGIFNWSLAGLARLEAQGKFSYAQSSEEARTEYKRENDAEATYMEDRIERGERFSIKADDLYRDYRGWCEDNGFKPKNRNTVSKDWKRLGMMSKHTKNGNFYIGIRIKNVDLRSDLEGLDNVQF